MKFSNYGSYTDAVFQKRMIDSRYPTELFSRLHTVPLEASSNFGSLVRFVVLLFTAMYISFDRFLCVDVIYIYIYVSDDDLIGQGWSHQWSRHSDNTRSDEMMTVIVITAQRHR